MFSGKMKTTRNSKCAYRWLSVLVVTLILGLVEINGVDADRWWDADNQVDADEPHPIRHQRNHHRVQDKEPWDVVRQRNNHSAPVNIRHRNHRNRLQTTVRPHYGHRTWTTVGPDGHKLRHRAHHSYNGLHRGTEPRRRTHAQRNWDNALNRNTTSHRRHQHQVDGKKGPGFLNVSSVMTRRYFDSDTGNYPPARRPEPTTTLSPKIRHFYDILKVPEKDRFLVAPVKNALDDNSYDDVLNDESDERKNNRRDMTKWNKRRSLKGKERSVRKDVLMDDYNEDDYDDDNDEDKVDKNENKFNKKPINDDVS